MDFYIVVKISRRLWFKPTVIHTICVLYTPTLLLCLSACISLRLSFPFIACRNRWTMDRLRSMPRLSLKIRGHPVMTSTRKGRVRLRWTHVDGGRGVQPHVDVHTEN